MYETYENWIYYEIAKFNSKTSGKWCINNGAKKFGKIELNFGPFKISFMLWRYTLIFKGCYKNASFKKICVQSFLSTVRFRFEKLQNGVSKHGPILFSLSKKIEHFLKSILNTKRASFFKLVLRTRNTWELELASKMKARNVEKAPFKTAV